MLDSLLVEFYGEPDKEEETMSETYTIKYVEGRKVYVNTEKEEFAVPTAQETFTMLSTRREKGFADATIFTNLTKCLARYEPGMCMHHYWKDVYNITERVYEARANELPPLAERRQEKPKGLFGFAKKGD
jgi:hypothetical protein